MDISRYGQAVRARRTRSHQDRLARAHLEAVRPASEDRYVVALTIAPSR